MNKEEYLKVIREQLDLLVKNYDNSSELMQRVTMGRIANYLQQENVIMEAITAEVIVKNL